MGEKITKHVVNAEDRRIVAARKALIESSAASSRMDPACSTARCGQVT